MKKTRSHFLTSLATCALVLFTASVTHAVSFSSVDLDLDDPNTPNSINVFETIVSVSSSGLTVSTDPFLVDYVDPNMRGLQVDLEVDFSDPNNPVVTSIEFVGEPGDISHQVQGGSVNVNDSGLVATVTPNGVRGFITSPGGPTAVNPDGSFNGANNSLVARQGTIDITGTFLGFPFTPISVSLADTPLVDFDEALSNGNTNTVEVTKTGSSGDTFFYDVFVSADLDQTNIDLVLTGGTANLVIDGTLQGRGQIEFTIPEPASMTLGSVALALLGLRLRRQD